MTPGTKLICVKNFDEYKEALLRVGQPKVPEVNEIYTCLETKDCECNNPKHLRVLLEELPDVYWWADHFREVQPLDVDSLIETAFENEPKVIVLEPELA